MRRAALVVLIAVAAAGVGAGFQAARPDLSPPKLWGTYAYSGGLQGDVWGPGNRVPGVLYPGIVVIHGGGFNTGSRAGIVGRAKLLAAHGFAVFSIDYTLGVPFPAAENDVEAAAAWFGDQDYISSVSAFGESAGAILATWLGARNIVQAAAGLSGTGVYDPAIPLMEQHVGCAQAECPQTWLDVAPVTYLDAASAPLFDAHGIQDPSLPIGLARATRDAWEAAGVPVDLAEFPTPYHSGPLWGYPGVQAATFAFLDQYAR